MEEELGTLYSDAPHKLYRLNDYVILNKLGRGSYGRVYLVRNKKNQHLYALKKLKIDQGVPTSTLREVSLLKILQHPNIVCFYQVLLTDKYCYMILEYMKMSLDMFIKDHEISPSLLQSFMFQLLQGILFCHNRSVLHRDIKSQNVLIDHCMKIVKLSDFGLARRVPHCRLPSSAPLTPTVVTLYYRSPELILKSGNYSSGIDIWSLGCVFVEMVLKQAPFRVDGEIDLFYSWFSQLGVPTEEDLPGAINKFNLIKFTAPEKNSTNAIMLLKSAVDPRCFDLIMKMFVYNPLKRIDAREALHHDFFSDFDTSVVPAINEENIGYSELYQLPKVPQQLYMNPEDVENLVESGDHSDNVNLDDNFQ